jgi:energy-coupling factor transporter ATP-binding protein EcfA2
MGKPITNIQLTGFRGSTGTFELDFAPQKNFTMLFGENGSGKSTILDAIDVVCNGTVGCLDNVSVGQGAGQYLCSLGCQPTALQVVLTSESESWTGTMRRNAISVAGATEKPVVRILRRSEVLQLILAQPADRYRALQRFIDISTVERSEDALRTEWSRVEGKINGLVSEQERASTRLNELWEAEGRPGPGTSAVEWARHRIATGIDQLTATLEQRKAVVSAIASAVAAKDNYRVRLQNHSDLVAQLRDIDGRIVDQPSVSAPTAVALLESLEKAKGYIEAEDALDHCPTCQRPMERAVLLEIVNREFDELLELKTLTDERQRVQGLANTATSHLDEALESLFNVAQTVQSAVANVESVEIDDLAITWPSWDAANIDAAALLAICASFEAIQADLITQRDNVQRDANQFNAVKGHVKAIDEAIEEAQSLTRIRDGLKRSLDIVHDRRVRFTQAILDGISQEANRLYQSIHPGENIGLDKLQMDSNRRASVNQTATFNGYSDVPPQAVFSESHLDTLGFCVWLALAKRESPEETILLIDDIFTSVDANHLSRIIDLLSAEAPHFLQVIVSTHYRLWWDRCQNANGIQRVHLGRWCASNGIAAQNMPLVTQQLHSLVVLPVLDRQAVSSKAGILLESILDDLATQYGCPLPRNRQNEYTLGALLNGCKKLFTKHSLLVQINTNWDADGQPESWQPSNAQGHYDRVDGLQFIRNQVGCHFNPPGMDIPDNDVRTFGQATVDLFTALTCPNCGMLPSKPSNDGTHLRCSCPKRAARLTPVAIQ